MASSGSARERLGWMGALGLGTWLSVRLARWLAERLSAIQAASGAGRAREPVRQVIQEVLTEHRADDTPVVRAFEAALEDEAAEEARV